MVCLPSQLRDGYIRAPSRNFRTLPKEPTSLTPLPSPYYFAIAPFQHSEENGLTANVPLKTFFVVALSTPSTIPHSLNLRLKSFQPIPDVPYSNPEDPPTPPSRHLSPRAQIGWHLRPPFHRPRRHHRYDSRRHDGILYRSSTGSSGTDRWDGSKADDAHSEARDLVSEAGEHAR